MVYRSREILITKFLTVFSVKVQKLIDKKAAPAFAGAIIVDKIIISEQLRRKFP